MKPLLISLVLLIVLAGCGSVGNELGDPVILDSTVPAPDAGFVTYTHPSGVFSMRMPASWKPEDLSKPGSVRVQFSVVEGDQDVVRLSVYVVNTGTPMSAEAFEQAANAYLPPEDIAAYEWHEIENSAQADHSRRIVGVRSYPMLGPRDLNIFLQRDGTFFSAMEVDVTGADAATLNTVRAVINTFKVDANATLDVSTVQQAAVVGVTSYSGVVAFDGYYAWTDREGVFHITGQVLNTTRGPLEAIVLAGILYDNQDRRLDEQSDILAVDVLKPGEAAPFDLRFEGGKPPSTVRYELEVAGRNAEYAASTFYGSENFVVANAHADYDNNTLVVRGELANIGTRPAAAVRVIVAIWDDQGHVVAAQTVFISKDQLVPQEAATFEVPIYEMGGAAVNYTLTVAGTVADTVSG